MSDPSHPSQHDPNAARAGTPWGPATPPGGPAWGPAGAPIPDARPPQAPRPGIIALRPLTIGELFEGTFAAFRQNIAVMLGLPAALFAIVGVVSGIEMRRLFADVERMESSFAELGPHSSPFEVLYGLLDVSVSSGLVALVSFLVSILLWAVVAIGVADAVIGRRPSIGEAVRRSRTRFLPLLGTLLLVGLVSALFILVALGAAIALGALFFAMADNSRSFESEWGIALLLVLLIVLVAFAIGLGVLLLTVRFLYAPVVCVLEELGPVESMSRSWALTRGRLGRTLGRYILIALVASAIAGILSGASSGLVSLAMTLGWSPTLLAISTAVSTFFASLIAPIIYGYTVLMYTDERIRSEGFAQVLAEAARR